MERLTHQRSSGIKTGYWSPNRKDELVERLAAYEDTGLDPQEIYSLKAGTILKAMGCKWIPVEEQLPKPYTNVLVTIKHSEWISDWDSTWVPVEEQRYHEATTDVTMAHLMCDGWEFFDEDSWSMCDEKFGDDRGKVYDVVVAWMPLPEQYRAD